MVTIGHILQNLKSIYAYWMYKEMIIPIKIMDIRQVFKRIDVLITPEGGLGKRWVSSEKVKVKNEKDNEYQAIITY